MEPTKAVTCSHDITPARAVSKSTSKVHGFRALYFHYVYLLRGAAKGRGSQKVSRYLLEDTIQFQKYLAQHRFLAELPNRNRRGTAIHQESCSPCSLILLCGSENHSTKKEGTPMKNRKRCCRWRSARAPPRSNQLRRELRLCAADRSGCGTGADPCSRCTNYQEGGAIP